MFGLSIFMNRMEAVRLRTISKVAAQNVAIIAVMDAADKNKVLMFIRSKYSSEGISAQAVDIYNNELFNTDMRSNTPSTVYSSDGSSIGCVSLKAIGSNHHIFGLTESKSRDELIVNMEQTANQQVATLRNSASLVMGEMSNSICSTCVDIRMQISLTDSQKFLIIALAVKLSITVYRIHVLPAPTVCLSKEAETEEEFLATMQDEPHLRFPLPLPGYRLQNQQPQEGMIIRSAGYSNSGIIYCDILDVISEQTTFTAECDMKAHKTFTISQGISCEIYHVCLQGIASIKTANRQLWLKTFGLMNSGDDEMFIVFDGNGKFIGKHKFGKFYGGDGKSVKIVVNKIDGNLLEAYNYTYDRLAAVKQHNSTTVVEIYESLKVTEGNSFLLSLALYAHFSLYGFHRLPMPLISFQYPSNNYTAKVFLF